MLEDIVKQAQAGQAGALFVECFFECLETNTKLVQTCKLSNLILARLLIPIRVSTKQSRSRSTKAIQYWPARQLF
jgi:hypothetical protein